MKKFLLTLTILAAMIACTRDVDRPNEPDRDHFFSKVKRYSDGRVPPVDTVWTLHLFTQSMVDSFTRMDGYVYNQTTTYVEVGVLWFK